MEVAIPQIEDLHRAVAHALLRKPTRLTSEEIRYLRTYLGWSSMALAAHMGTTPETVSRWEHGATPIGKTADRLLRLLVATQIPASADVVETLPAITTTTPPQAVRLSLLKNHDGWHAAAAVTAG
jgi:DNA-binding transcriptional regulator YiaG